MGERVECPECRIEMERVATLGTWEDSLSFTGFPVVREDGHGGYYVIAFGGYHDRILSYGPEGRLRATIGRGGDGPGEFGYLLTLATGREDTVFVADYNRRISVFAPPPSNQFVRSFNVPVAPRDIVELSGGDLAVAGMRFTPEHVGLPIQLVDRSSGDAAAMGAIDPIVRPDLRSTDDRRLSPSNDGSLWSAHTTAYVLERWSTEGDLLQNVALDLDWFPPREPSPRQPVDHGPIRPEPRIVGIAEQGDELWAAISAADSEWTVERAASVDDPTGNALSDGVIHVLRPQTGEILAEVRIAEVPKGMTQSGLIVTLRELPPGLLVIDLWKPRLVGDPSFSINSKEN